MRKIFGGKSKLKKETIEEICYIALCVLLPCFSFFAYAPLQLYLANRNEFWFNASAMVGPIAVCTITVILILFAAGMLLKQKKHRYFYGALFLGLGVAIFVQGDYINLNLGVLNGAEIIWSEYLVRFVVNAIVWGAIILASVILAKKAGRKFMQPACIAASVILLLQLVTLFVLGLSGEKKHDSSDYVWTTKNIFTLSEEENVVVFLMDMFDSRYVEELIDQNDPVLDRYDNFVFYRNHTGSYSATQYSLGSLFINDYIDNSYPTFRATIDSKYNSKTNIFPSLAKNGVSLDIYCPLTPAIPSELCEANTAGELSKYIINDQMGFTKTLYKLCASKFAPDFVKPYVWMDSSAFDTYKNAVGDNDVYSYDNIVLHQLFQGQQIVKDDKQHFKFIYGQGVHYPYTNDENFNPISDSHSHEDAIGAAKSVLKLCTQYIDMMKEAGVYDNTTIIIMADHGYYWDGVLTNPLMMIKPCNSQKPFEISDAPTSHINFQGTVASVFGYNDDGRYGVSISNISKTDTPERLFYQYNLQEGAVGDKFRLIEYRIAPEGNDRKMFSLTDRDIGRDGTVTIHHEHCVYCQINGMEPEDLPNDERIVHTYQ